MIQEKQNPFRFDVEVDGTFFCGRKEDIEESKDAINNQINIIMFAKRRIGKTSLIKEIFKYHLDPSILKVSVDIYSISSVRELYDKLKEGIEKSLIGNKTSLEKMQELIKDLQTYFKNAKVSLEISDKPKVKIESIQQDYNKAIEALFEDYFSYLKAKGNKSVIAIDEFQKIATLSNYKDIEALLRTIVIKREELASFIFSGSKRTLLQTMFNDPDRAFYKLGMEHPLEPIERDIFYKWVNDKFKNKDIFMEESAFNYLYNECEGETRFIQKVCHILYSKTNETSIIDETLMSESIDRLIKKNIYIPDMFNRYSLTKQKALKLLANISSDYYKKEYLEFYDISKASLQSSISGLLKDDDIYIDNNGVYRFEDVELKMYLLSI